MVSQEARKALLKQILADPNLLAKVRLSKVAAVHNDELTILADFTEADFQGYSSVIYTVIHDGSSNINANLQAETGLKEFVFSAGLALAAQQTCFAAYITYTDFTNTQRLLWHEFFAVPKIINAPDDEIGVKIDWFLTNLVP